MSLELKKVENTADILSMIERASRGMRITNIDSLIQEFMFTEEPVMEIAWKGTYTNVNSAVATFSNRIKKMQYHARVVKVRDKLYLLNLEKS